MCVISGIVLGECFELFTFYQPVFNFQLKRSLLLFTCNRAFMIVPALHACNSGNDLRHQHEHDPSFDRRDTRWLLR